MSNTQVREITDARVAAAPEVGSSEPSHIHIPRPSRVAQSIDSRRDGADSIPVQLLEEAA